MSESEPDVHFEVNLEPACWDQDAKPWSESFVSSTRAEDVTCPACRKIVDDLA